MANYTTSADIIDDVLTRAGEPIDTSSDEYSNVVRWVNRAYQGIWSGGSEIDPNIQEAWWWLRKDSQGVLTLNPLINTGTVNVSNNSTSITFSSAPTPSVAGRHFKVDGHADVFVISSHTAGEVGATLESVYTGSDDSAASYRVMQFDYDLASDVLYLNDPMWAWQDSEREINLIDLNSMREKWSINNLHQGVPRNFAMTAQGSVRFSHFGGLTSTDLIKVDYEYMRIPADLDDDSNEPVVPRQYRKILADWALGMLLDKKEDSRAAGAFALARNGLLAMQREHRRQILTSSDVFGKIQPRQYDTIQSNHILRTESGLIIG